MVDEKTRQKAHKHVDRVMDKTEDVVDSGRETIDRFKQRANYMRKSTDDYIKKNPEKSVLIAAGAGFLIGALITASVMKKSR